MTGPRTLQGRVATIGAAGLLVTALLSSQSAVADRSSEVRAPRGLTEAVTSPLGAPVPAQWLKAFNHYRALAGLPPVTEDTVTLSSGFTWSNGARKHSKYMVFEGITHYESTSSPFYTAEGDSAGRNGNVMTSSLYETTSRSAIESWITAPFHAIGMLDPKLARTGYGEFKKQRNGNQFGATVDVLRGLEASAGPGVTFPIMFPANDKTVYLDRYPGGEIPDPLTAANGQCNSYAAPTGLPIYLLLDSEEELQSTSFKRGANDLDHCAYDDDGYTGSEPGDSGMGPRNAIFLIPKKPLASERRFHVSITTSGGTYSWFFRTGDIKAPWSKVKKPASSQLYDRDTLSKIVGTASGDTQRVHTAIGATELGSNFKCRFLKADGSFTSKRDCSRQVWLKATGKANWSRALSKKLPPTYPQGKYAADYYYVFSRAADEVGNVEIEPEYTGKYHAFHVKK